MFFLQTQNSVYEIVSDVNSRQDIIEERLTCLEEKLNNIQLSLELLPDMLTRWGCFWKVSWCLIVSNVGRLLQQQSQTLPVAVTQCPPVSDTPSLNISSSRSCPGPPGPWLPAVSAAPTASHQLSSQLPPANNNSCHLPTSYSVTNRLNNMSNQLSVDSGGSGPHMARGPTLEPRQPPQYSESQVRPR